MVYTHQLLGRRPYMKTVYNRMLFCDRLTMLRVKEWMRWLNPEEDDIIDFNDEIPCVPGHIQNFSDQHSYRIKVSPYKIKHYKDLL